MNLQPLTDVANWDVSAKGACGLQRCKLLVELLPILEPLEPVRTEAQTRRRFHAATPAFPSSTTERM